MTQATLKKMYQLLLTEPHAPTVCAQLERIAREALAEHAMCETQRLGQEIEQCQCPECQIKPHASDCAVHSEPAYPKGKCDCGAQPEQEPVAWRNAAIRVGEDLSSVGPDGYYDMTAQQWLDWAMEQQPHGKNSLAQPDQYAKGYADAMNWKVQNHLEHLPTAQPEQEPVATVTSETGADITMSWWHEPALPVGTKLYTHPPQRTWVGLNEDEIDYLIHLAYTGDEEFVQTIEAKLKEKNT